MRGKFVYFFISYTRLSIHDYLILRKKADLQKMLNLLSVELYIAKVYFKK